METSRDRLLRGEKIGLTNAERQRQIRNQIEREMVVEEAASDCPRCLQVASKRNRHRC